MQGSLGSLVQVEAILTILMRVVQEGLVIIVIVVDFLHF